MKINKSTHNRNKHEVQTFGLSIAGGHLAAGRSAARLSENAYDCSGALSFTILDSSALLTGNDVDAATSLRVLRGGAIVDTESGFAIQKNGVAYSC